MPHSLPMATRCILCSAVYRLVVGTVCLMERTTVELLLVVAAVGAEVADC